VLLESIEKIGAGNWKVIVDYMTSSIWGFNKTLRQVEDHYWDLYMGVHGLCLPKSAIVNDSVVDVALLLEKEEFRGDDSNVSKFIILCIILCII